MFNWKKGDRSSKKFKREKVSKEIQGKSSQNVTDQQPSQDNTSSQTYHNIQSAEKNTFSLPYGHSSPKRNEDRIEDTNEGVMATPSTTAKEDTGKASLESITRGSSINVESIHQNREGYIAHDQPSEHFNNRSTPMNRGATPDQPVKSSLTDSTGKSRSICLSKDANGEFGIILRQFRVPALPPLPGDVESQHGSSDRVVIIIEPVLEGSIASTEIKNGDALLAVNGKYVSRWSKETIANEICQSGEKVILTVVNMPRFARDEQSRVNLGLNDRGNNIAKSEEQVNSEKEWFNKDRVWCVGDNGFVAARVLQRRQVKGRDESVYVLPIDAADKATIEVEEENIERANPPQFDRVEDLLLLRYLNESSCLHSLQNRFLGNLIHTFAGQDLIVVNPRQQLNIYSDKVMRMFGSCRQEDMPPHIFAVAQSAYRNMLTLQCDQSMIFLGSSGSGKSTNYKHTLDYFTKTLLSQNGRATPMLMDAALSVVESFGCARTALCANASRFSLLTSLHFDTSGQMAGAQMQIFLVEKSRVVHQPSSESSFKVFYEMLSCQDKKIKSDLLLNNRLVEDNCFFNAKEMNIDSSHHANGWTRLMNSLQLLGISRDESMALFSPLSAIIHLGEAGVVINEQNGKPQFARLSSAQRAATVLGITEEELNKVIFSSAALRAKVAKQHADSLFINSNINSDEVSLGKFDGLSIYSEASIVPFEMCTAALKGFAMGLYMEAFSAAVRLVNRAISTNVQSQTALHFLDMPGFQNPKSVGAKSNGASFEDLCVNYCYEKMNWLKHFTTVTTRQDRYARENIDVSANNECSSNEDILGTFDKLKLDKHLTKESHGSSKGLLWMLEDEASRPNNSELVFVEKLKSQHHVDRAESIIQEGQCPESFTVNHQFKSTPVVYNSRGWFKMVKEHPVIRMAYTLLTESKKKCISDMYIGSRSGVLQVEVARHRNTKQARPSMKKNSVFLHLKIQLETIIDSLRRTNPKFVHCLSPDTSTEYSRSSSFDSSHSGGITSSRSKAMPHFNMQHVIQQFRGMQLLAAMRSYRQGYPEHMTYAEFRRRFFILAPKDDRLDETTILDERQAVATLTLKMELDQRSFKLGLSQIFLRAGCLAQFEDARDATLNETVIAFQARCRGYIGRRHIKQIKVQHLALTCVQRNIRKFFSVRSWPWWKLYTSVLPLLDVHRTEQELQTKSNEVDILQSRISKLQNENVELESLSRRLQKKVDEVTIASCQAVASATNSNELLEQEMSDRLSIEQELQQLKECNDSLQERYDDLHSKVGHQSLSTYGVAHENDSTDGEDSIDKARYKSLLRDYETLKLRMTEQAEEEIDDYIKKQRHIERQLADEIEQSEDLRRQLNNIKRKYNNLQADSEDMKLIVETTQSRNADLERRQRKFDVDIANVRGDLASLQKRLQESEKEKESAMTEKLVLEHSLRDFKEEHESMKRKAESLESELEQCDNGGAANSKETVVVRRELRELRMKYEDQEDELDEQAGEIQQLKQVKLRLEMASQKDKQQYQKDLEAKEESTEQIKLECARKIKLLDEQLEDESRIKSEAIKIRRDLERKVFDLQNSVDDVGTVGDRRLRKELRRMQALYKDAKNAADQKNAQNVDKATVKELRSQIDDLQFTKHVAVKSKKQIESDVTDLEEQLKQIASSRQEVDDKVFILSKQLAVAQERIEDDEADMKDILKKNKQLINQISELEVEKVQLKESVEKLLVENDISESKILTLSNRLQTIENNSVDKLELTKLEIRLRDLEQRLDIEMTLKARLENQVNRLKDNSSRLLDERDAIHSKEGRAAVELAKVTRQMKNQRDEIEAVYQQEAEHKRRRDQTEGELIVAEENIMALKTELHLANKRICDLQDALEREMMVSDDDDDDDLDCGNYNDEPSTELTDIFRRSSNAGVFIARTNGAGRRRTSMSSKRRDSIEKRQAAIRRTSLSR